MSRRNWVDSFLRGYSFIGHIKRQQFADCFPSCINPTLWIERRHNTFNIVSANEIADISNPKVVEKRTRLGLRVRFIAPTATSTVR